MFVEIDGSMGEGGGQILRYSLGFSAVLGRPVRIRNIRAKRSNPGLRPQHLTAVRALAEITDAEVEGDRVGSMELSFRPRRRRGGFYRFDIGTAGSISLVIQAILPALLYADRPSHVEITGGTDVQWSPPIDYMRHVFQHNIGLFGASFQITLHRRGHYPRGGGRVTLTVEPVKDTLKPVGIVERGRILWVRGISHAVRLPSHVAHRQAEAAEKLIAKKLGVKPSIEREYYEKGRDPHPGPGSGIVLYAGVEAGSILGSDSLGARGKRAERVGEEAAEELLEDLGTGMGFDRHMADMLIPYMFLARGASRAGVARVTGHALTAIEVSKIIIGRGVKVNIEGAEGSPGIISVEGIGFSP